jgi:hypothetical protein
MPTDYTSPAMTIDNMRALGVRSIRVTCQCGLEAVVDVSGLSGVIEVPALRWRLRCTECAGRPSMCGRTGASTARKGEGDSEASAPRSALSLGDPAR